MSMRERFYDLLREALEDDPRVAAVTAEIGTASLGPHPRHFNVGIREQLMIGVAAGLALEGWAATRVDGRDHDALAEALTPDPHETRPRCVVAQVTP